jgi:hypothetical protein
MKWTQKERKTIRKRFGVCEKKRRKYLIKMRFLNEILINI